MSYWKTEIKPILESYLAITKGGYIKMHRELKISQSTFSNYVFKDRIPNYDRGRLIEEYLDKNYQGMSLTKEEIEAAKYRKRFGPRKDEVQKKETYYQELKRKGLLKLAN